MEKYYRKVKERKLISPLYICVCIDETLRVHMSKVKETLRDILRKFWNPIISFKEIFRCDGISGYRNLIFYHR